MQHHTPKNKRQMSMNIDDYLAFRLDALAEFWGKTKTEIITRTLDEFFSIVDNNANNYEARYWEQMDEEFLKDHPDYTLTEYRQLNYLYNNGNGRLSMRLAQRSK